MYTSVYVICISAYVDFQLYRHKIDNRLLVDYRGFPRCKLNYVNIIIKTVSGQNAR